MVARHRSVAFELPFLDVDERMIASDISKLDADDVSLDVLLIIIFDNRIEAEVSAENDSCWCS